MFALACCNFLCSTSQPRSFTPALPLKWMHLYSFGPWPCLFPALPTTWPRCYAKPYHARTWSQGIRWHIWAHIWVLADGFLSWRQAEVEQHCQYPYSSRSSVVFRSPHICFGNKQRPLEWQRPSELLPSVTALHTNHHHRGKASSGNRLERFTDSGETTQVNTKNLFLFGFRHYKGWSALAKSCSYLWFPDPQLLVRPVWSPSPSPPAYSHLPELLYFPQFFSPGVPQFPSRSSDLHTAWIQPVKSLSHTPKSLLSFSAWPSKGSEGPGVQVKAEVLLNPLPPWATTESWGKQDFSSPPLACFWAQIS